MWAETTEGMHNLFRLSSLRQPRGLLLQAARRPRAAPARTPRASSPRTGCPSGEVQTRLRLGQYDEARRDGGRVPGHLRQGQLLPRADGPRHRRSRSGSATTCCASADELGIPPVATNDSHYTQPRGRRGPRRPDLRRVRQATLGRHQPAQVRRRRLLHQVRRGDARRCGRTARHEGGVRQHPR